MSEEKVLRNRNHLWFSFKKDLPAVGSQRCIFRVHVCVWGEAGVDTVSFGKVKRRKILGSV